VEPRKAVLICKARGSEKEGGGPPKEVESSEEASTIGL